MRGGASISRRSLTPALALHEARTVGGESVRVTVNGKLGAVVRYAGRVSAAVLAIPITYVVAAVIGTLLPRNAGWQEPDRGIEIFVRTNGVHSDLVLPASTAGVDWYRRAPPEHAADPTAAQGWVAIGWGQRDFYLETETWADLDLRTAVGALLGGEALMHVGHLSRPRPSDATRPLRIDADGYRRMSAAIHATFQLDDSGNAIPLLGAGYGEHDLFYEAEGVYHAFRTSNQWTADMLAAGGVRVGIWTPFEQGVMWRLRR
jgi:uncharacterized protein (TIGR02117 family)